MASTTLKQDKNKKASTSETAKRERRKFLSSPGILFLILVTQVPFALALYYSFTNWNLLRPTSTGFIGWDRLWLNYRRILTNSDFYYVLWNTLYLTLSVVVITFVVGLAFALLLNRPFPGRALARTLLISPFLMMPVAAAVLWKNLLARPLIRAPLLVFWTVRRAELLRAAKLSDGDGNWHRLVAVDTFCDADSLGGAPVFARFDGGGGADRRGERLWNVSPYRLTASEALYRNRAAVRNHLHPERVRRNFRDDLGRTGFADDELAVSDFLGGVLSSKRRTRQRVRRLRGDLSQFYHPCVLTSFTQLG